MGEFGTARAVINCFSAAGEKPRNKRLKKRYYKAIIEYAKSINKGDCFNFWEIYSLALKELAGEAVDVKAVDDFKLQKKHLCNKCGKDCSIKIYDQIVLPNGDTDENLNAILNGKRFSYQGGYFSEVFDDLSEVKFTLCEDCILGLIEGFKFPVKLYETDTKREYPDGWVEKFKSRIKKNEKD